MTTLLATLGLDQLDEPVTDAHIRAAYTRLCLKHHPDRLHSSDPDAAAAAAARFVAINEAYEALTGEDGSLAEAAGSSLRAPPTAGDTCEVAGVVTSARRHGKKLAMARVAQAGDVEGVAYDVRDAQEVGIVFRSALFDYASEADGYSAFPSAKRSLSVGDTLVASCVWAIAEAGDNAVVNGGHGLDLCVHSWRRTDGAEGVEGRGEVTRRRSGKAAVAGWVKCPLCSATSGRRFNRGEGLRRHLDAVHASELEAAAGDDAAIAAWHAKIAAKADADGVAARRCAGITRGSGISGGDGGERGMSYVQNDNTALAREEPGSRGLALVGAHPGLVAARDGDEATLLRLLSEGWQVFARASLDRHGASALDWAAGAGHLRCVELLAPQAAGVVSCRRDGREAIHWASRHGRTEVVKFLLKLEDGTEGSGGGSGCSGGANRRTTNGTSCLHFACYGDHLETAQALLERGADLYATNAWACDATHFAAMGGATQTLEWLVTLGMPIDRKQRNHHAPLHKAADRGHVECCRWLLDHSTVDQLTAVATVGSASEDSGGSCLEGALSSVQDATGERGDGNSNKVGEATGRDIQIQQRQREAHLPSSLAQRNGHGECAALLRERGL